MNICIKVIYISVLLLLTESIKAQSYLTNPSLEDRPSDATMPNGWFAASEGTTPDILPGYWGVYLEPEDGESYVGLITRSNGTYESISQRLESPLKQDNCYSMKVSLAHGENYTGYNTPVQLRIWLSTKKNKREQLIYTSPALSDEEWKTLGLEFVPKKEMKYMIFEAHNPHDKNVEGNILLDKIIGPYNCNKA